jgi:hypothetical protein
MDERLIIDHLHQLWSKTTHAGKGEWFINKDEHILVDIESVDDTDWEQTIAFGSYEYDADFITAVHAAMPALSRLFHAAWDEADRLSRDMDIFQGRLASAEMRVDELKMELVEANYINSRLRQEYADSQFDLAQELETVAELQSEVETLKADLEGLIAG